MAFLSLAQASCRRIAFDMPRRIASERSPNDRSWSVLSNLPGLWLLGGGKARETTSDMTFKQVVERRSCTIRQRRTNAEDDGHLGPRFYKIDVGLALQFERIQMKER